jgi:hypothetical protein
MKNVKKILIIIGIIIIVMATCFFSGYSIGRTRLNDTSAGEDSALIRKQLATIKSLEGRLRGAIKRSDTIAGRGETVKSGLDELGNGLNDIEAGVSEDIEGISGVIDRLKHYRGKGDILEESNSN